MGRTAEERKATPAPVGKSCFLGIGIDEYQHFGKLHNAVRDMEAISNLLLSDYDLHKDNCRWLRNAEATRKGILRSLSELDTWVGQHDKLIIYYSGHGHLNRNKRGFWVPVEAAPGEEEDFVSNARLRELLADIPARHILLISDSCFSGTLFVRAASRADVAVEEMEKITSRWALCSGRHDQLVADGPKDGHSPFAASILTELRRHPTDALRIGTLADRVIELTRANYDQLPEGNPLQGVGHQGGQYVFRRRLNEAQIWADCEKTATPAAWQYYLGLFPEGEYAAAARQNIQNYEGNKAWEAILALPDESSREVDRKIGQIRHFCAQYRESTHFEEALRLGQNLEAKREYLSLFHSEFGLMTFVRKDTPYRAAAEERLLVLQKKPILEPPKPSPTPPPKKPIEQKQVVDPRKEPAPPQPIWKNLRFYAYGLIGALFIVFVVMGVRACGSEQKADATPSTKAAHAEQLTMLDARLQQAYTLRNKDSLELLRPLYNQLVEAPDAARRVNEINTWLISYQDSLKKIGKPLPSVDKPEVKTTSAASTTPDAKGKSEPKTKPAVSPPPSATKPSPVTALVASIANNMVSIAGGTFTMGCQDGRDTDCFNDEKPAHQVTLRSFYLSKYEVTQAQWRAVMGSDPPELFNTGCDQCPVESVSWDDIQGFLSKLNTQTGQNYRLPTEAEWEFAARGGNNSKGYPYSGSNTIGKVAWYRDNAEAGNTNGTRKRTRPVGGLQANELGLYDMSGNVPEWCNDRHGTYPNSPQQNPQGADKGTFRVYRGGGWHNYPRNCRAANRNSNTPTFRDYVIGFRLAR
jgi:formylglycine-generating enzyme required for sulfatase activity